MQKNPTTSRMQSSCWANYYRPVPMIRFAAAVRAGPAQQSLATVKWKIIVMQGHCGSTQRRNCHINQAT